MPEVPTLPNVWAARTVAVVGLVAASPALLLGALSIRLSSPGPVLFKARRVGLDGAEFTMLKLRTMHVGAPHAGAITASADPRVFPAGRWLRRLKIDEIPQLVNVARGDMAFFGPRPESPAIVAKDYKPWMLETLSVRPGIVGPGSLGYFEEEADLPEDAQEAEDYYVEVLLPRKLARDLVFVRAASTRYRLELLVRTALGVLGLDVLTARARAREDALAQELKDSLESAS